jgi:tetratricopeptide (TPR) repeat protein
MSRLKAPATRPQPNAVRRRALLIALAALILIAAGFAVFSARSRAEAARLLPLLPPLAGRPAALVAHLEEADRVARRSPHQAEAVGELGMAYHADLFYDQATAAYSLAATLDPSDWRWPYYRALVHVERGEAAKAVAALETTVRLRPDLSLGWWRLGEANFKQGRYEEADRAYLRAESSAPPQEATPGIGAYAQAGRARVALNRGDAAAALAILTKLVERAPRFGLAHRILADTFRAQGREGDALRESAIGSTLRLYAAPSDPQLDTLADRSRSSVFLLRQAASLDLSREASRREQLVRRALDSDPDNPDVVYEMGALLQQLRRPADALPYFTRHLDLVDDDRQTLVQLGKVYADLGRDDDAETTIKRALALGDDAVGFYNLGIVMEHRDRIAEAETAYRRAIALGPGLASARNNLGALLAARGQLNDAARELLESIRLDPSAPDAYTNLSAVRLQQGNDSEAGQYARLAIEVEPRQADAHANLGVALARQGNLDAAQREFEAALAINPRHVNARRNLDAIRLK